MVHRGTGTVRTAVATAATMTRDATAISGMTARVGCVGRAGTGQSNAAVAG